MSYAKILLIAYGKCKHPGIVQKWIQLGKPEGHIIEAEYRKKLLKAPMVAAGFDYE